MSTIVVFLISFCSTIIIAILSYRAGYKQGQEDAATDLCNPFGDW